MLQVPVPSQLFCCLLRSNDGPSEIRSDAGAKSIPMNHTRTTRSYSAGLADSKRSSRPDWPQCLQAMRLRHRQVQYLSAANRNLRTNPSSARSKARLCFDRMCKDTLPNEYNADPPATYSIVCICGACPYSRYCFNGFPSTSACICSAMNREKNLPIRISPPW